MTEKELTTTLFIQAFYYHLVGDEKFAEDIILSAMQNHFTGCPYPTLRTLLQ